MLRTKICGLRDKPAIDAAVEGGAAYIGFVFFEKSPRYVSPETAAQLAELVPPGICKVGLVVNPDDQLLDQITQTAPLDMIQLHGSETAKRVAEVKARTGLPVMKAIGIAAENDVPAIEEFAQVADQILIDAKPPKGAAIPGGNGIPFDWKLIAGRRWAVPWMLSGGLTTENMAQAVKLTGAAQIDLSSGVESTRGVKDPKLVRRFLQQAATI